MSARDELRKALEHSDEMLERKSDKLWPAHYTMLREAARLVLAEPDPPAEAPTTHIDGSSSVLSTHAQKAAVVSGMAEDTPQELMSPQQLNARLTRRVERLEEQMASVIRGLNRNSEG